MSEFKSWGDVAKSQQRQSGGIERLKMVSGNNYVIRFAGAPVKFFKYFVSGKSANCADPESCIIKRKYGIDPSERWAFNVIDRADGKVKILELPPAALKPVTSWWKIRKHEPGGDNGCDFNIEVTGVKKGTRYLLTPLDITPLTAEEKALKLYNLDKLYQPTPDAEIESRLFGKGEGAPEEKQAAATGNDKEPAKAGGWSSDPPF